MRKIYGISFLFLLLLASAAVAQKKVLTDSPKYEQLKKAGKLKESMVIKDDKQEMVISPIVHRNSHGTNQQSAFHALCNCMIPIDTSFQVVPFTNGTAPDYRNDDGSSPLITLPFNFCLYGTTYTSVYINNNGNISFNSPYFTYSANGFPDATHAMVAPFWADVDTRIGTGNPGGLVYYKITPTSMIVRWDSVGYFNEQTDKLNSFQLIITDGTDPILPSGNNVDFCYGDMSWTTGSASQGVNGFGGVPATVGANAGDGVDFVQFGRFDEPGLGYDGPFGANDSVDFLDNQNFIFNSCTSGGASNIAPIVHGLVVCDTILACASDSAFRDTIPIVLDFLSPEQGQTTVITPSYAGTGQFTIISNTSGSIAHLDAQLILGIGAVGLNTVTIIATDNGTPPAADTLNIAFKIDTFPLSPPSITGSHYYCAGGSGVTLSVGNIYNSYSWSDGTTGVNTHSVLTGTYNCEVTNVNGCRAKTPAFPVWEITPDPIIGGVTALCGVDSAHLQTTIPFAHYQWLQAGSPTGDTTASITVHTSGDYSVFVTDSIGCTATSPVLNVSPHPNPSAAFSYSPLNGLAGDTIHFTDLSFAGSGNIVSWLWNFGDGATSTSTLQNPTHAYAAIGEYPVTLTVTQTDGCTNTITMTYSGEPNAVIPFNIFTPNNDGKNDAFFFKNLEFYPNSELNVFNRWGRRVFESPNYQNDWKAGDLSDGVYYYVLKIPEKETLKGTVTIKR